MADNEIKESHQEVSRIVKKPVENIYGLASLYRVFFARLIDVLIIAIPSLIVIWAWKSPIGVHVSDTGQKTIEIYGASPWVHTVVNLVVQLCSILIFLVFIPSFTKGTTIGKGICGIRLKGSKGDKKVKWYMLLARESYFLLVPWIIGLAFNCIGLGIWMGSHDGNFGTAKVISQLGYVFYFLWFVFLLVTIKAQSEHQAGIDMHFGLFVVYKEPIRQITKDVVVKEKSLILTDEPGNLAKDNLEELRNDEKHKFSKSISLEDLDIEIDQEKLESKKHKSEETKKIEHDDKDKKKDKGDKK